MRDHPDGNEVWPTRRDIEHRCGVTDPTRFDRPNATRFDRPNQTECDRPDEISNTGSTFDVALLRQRDAKQVKNIEIPFFIVFYDMAAKIGIFINSNSNVKQNLRYRNLFGDSVYSRCFRCFKFNNFQTKQTRQLFSNKLRCCYLTLNYKPAAFR